MNHNLDPNNASWQHLHPLSPVFMMGRDRGRDDHYVGALLWAIILLPLTVLGCVLSWRSSGYALIGDTFYFKKGVFMRQNHSAKFDRIKGVIIDQPVLPSIFGMSHVEVELYGGDRSGIILGFMSTDKALQFQTQILTVQQQIGRAYAPQGMGTTPPTMGAANPVMGTSMQNLSPVTPATVGTSSVPNPDFSGNKLIYKVPFSRSMLVGFLGLFSLRAFLLLSCVLISAIVFALIKADPVTPASLVFLTGGAWICYGFVEAAESVGFQAVLTPQGISISTGMFHRRHFTIKPEVVHGLVVKQYFWWRPFGFYRVSGIYREFGSASSTRMLSTVLLPAGKEADMFRAIWLLYPDLGVADPVGTLRFGLHGSGDGYGYVVNPPRAKIFDPLTYKRNAHLLTSTHLLVRSKRFLRELTMIPYARIQQIRVKQSALAAQYNLADISVELVDGQSSGPKGLDHLDVDVARYLYQELQRRSAGQPNSHGIIDVNINPEIDWYQRVYNGL